MREGRFKLGNHKVKGTSSQRVPELGEGCDQTRGIHLDSHSYAKDSVLESGGLEAPWFGINGEKGTACDARPWDSRVTGRASTPTPALPGLRGASHALPFQSHPTTPPIPPNRPLPILAQAASEDWEWPLPAGATAQAQAASQSPQRLPPTAAPTRRPSHPPAPCSLRGHSSRWPGPGTTDRS